MYLYRYFFHAASGRMSELDHDEGGDKEVTSQGDLMGEKAEEKEEEEEGRRDMAGWFRGGMDLSETESDHDSDKGEEWEEVKGGESSEEEEEEGDDDGVKMGETEEAMEYDENLIFRHL